MATAPNASVERPAFDARKGLPNAFSIIALVGSLFVFACGFGAASSLPAGVGIAMLIVVCCSGFVGCLMLYAVGVVVATLRAINHNICIRGQRN